MAREVEGPSPATHGRPTEQGGFDVPTTMANTGQGRTGNAGYQPQHSPFDGNGGRKSVGATGIPPDRGSTQLWPLLLEQFEDRAAAPIILALRHKGSGKSFQIMSLIKHLPDNDM